MNRIAADDATEAGEISDGADGDLPLAVVVCGGGAPTCSPGADRDAMDPLLRELVGQVKRYQRLGQATSSTRYLHQQSYHQRDRDHGEKHGARQKDVVQTIVVLAACQTEQEVSLALARNRPFERYL
ncbi:unnamed protein product [Prorocentrum cordatum]|uniref:Uncharacterized protein n=1 Tax=Prorocentrum cordatum TaxID=2364126 RepID=A0ABN9WIV3_9DINO|nr:unnamed protein product [Polarella glacialis]